MTYALELHNYSALVHSSLGFWPKGETAFLPYAQLLHLEFLLVPISQFEND